MSEAKTGRYAPRIIDGRLAELIEGLPALMLVGPRAAGKTTTAARHAQSVVRLDRADEAAVFLADPDAALASLPEPVLLDEWQEVPGVLGAVKRSVDSGQGAGRFLLTGSVRALFEHGTWPGTGRVVEVKMFGMSVRERTGNATGTSFLDRLATRNELHPATDSPDIRGYVDLALQSGFPEPALTLTPKLREAWLRGYVEQVVGRDMPGLAGPSDPILLNRFLEAWALNSAGVVTDETLRASAGINHRTATRYEQLLANTFVVESLPAWSSNRLSRLTKAPKRYVVDPGLLGAILGVDAGGVLRDGDLLGRVLDTFVTAELRAEVASSESRPRLHHLRQMQGRHEVDLLVEFAGGNVAGIEIKATAAPNRRDARHLEWLQAELGNRFIGGVVFHTGPRAFQLTETIVAAPISTIWS